MAERRLVAATHDGRFHADDVMGAALLLLAHGDRVSFARTRDPARVAAADVAFDVGGEHDPARGRFDHHLADPPRRPCGTPYSAFGLLWAHHGRAVVAALGDPATAGDVEEAWASVDGGLALAVDEVDNGLREPGPDGLATLVDATAGDGDAGFEACVAFARAALRGTVRRACEAVAGRAAVREAAARRTRPEVLWAPVRLAWEGAVFDLGLDDVLYVVGPRTDGAWSVTCVPPHRGSMAQRRPLPGAWAGLSGGALAAACGVADAVFAHRNRFMAVAASPEGALAMAGEALRGVPRREGPAPVGGRG